MSDKKQSFARLLLATADPSTGLAAVADAAAYQTLGDTITSRPGLDDDTAHRFATGRAAEAVWAAKQTSNPTIHTLLAAHRSSTVLTALLHNPTISPAIYRTVVQRLEPRTAKQLGDPTDPRPSPTVQHHTYGTAPIDWLVTHLHEATTNPDSRWSSVRHWNSEAGPYISWRLTDANPTDITPILTLAATRPQIAGIVTNMWRIARLRAVHQHGPHYQTIADYYDNLFCQTDPDNAVRYLNSTPLTLPYAQFPAHIPVTSQIADTAVHCYQNYTLTTALHQTEHGRRVGHLQRPLHMHVPGTSPTHPQTSTPANYCWYLTEHANQVIIDAVSKYFPAQKAGYLVARHHPNYHHHAFTQLAAIGTPTAITAAAYANYHHPDGPELYDPHLLDYAATADGAHQLALFADITSNEQLRTAITISNLRWSPKRYHEHLTEMVHTGTVPERDTAAWSILTEVTTAYIMRVESLSDDAAIMYGFRVLLDGPTGPVFRDLASRSLINMLTRPHFTLNSSVQCQTVIIDYITREIQTRTGQHRINWDLIMTLILDWEDTIDALIETIAHFTGP